MVQYWLALWVTCFHFAHTGTFIKACNLWYNMNHPLPCKVVHTVYTLRWLRELNWSDIDCSLSTCWLQMIWLQIATSTPALNISTKYHSLGKLLHSISFKWYLFGLWQRELSKEPANFQVLASYNYRTHMATIYYIICHNITTIFIHKLLMLTHRH